MDADAELNARGVDKALPFYQKLFGGTVVLERDPVILRVANTWLILNEGGGPTDDKPAVSLETEESSPAGLAIRSINCSALATQSMDSACACGCPSRTGRRPRTWPTP